MKTSRAALDDAVRTVELTAQLASLVAIESGWGSS